MSQWFYSKVLRLLVLIYGNHTHKNKMYLRISKVILPETTYYDRCCCCLPTPPCLLGGVRICCFTGVRHQLLPPVI